VPCGAAQGSTDFEQFLLLSNAVHRFCDPNRLVVLQILPRRDRHEPRCAACRHVQDLEGEGAHPGDHARARVGPRDADPAEPHERVLRQPRAGGADLRQARLLAGIASGPGRRNLTVEVTPDSGHGYLRMQGSNPMAPGSPTMISRVLFERIEKWLALQGLTRR